MQLSSGSVSSRAITFVVGHNCCPIAPVSCFWDFNFLKIFQSCLFFYLLNGYTFSSVKVETLLFHLSVPFLELYVPCGVQLRSVHLCTGKKERKMKNECVTERKILNYKNDLKMA